MIRINKELVNFVSQLHRAKPDGFITERFFAPRSVVVEQGEKNEFVYIIKSGIAKCFLSNEDGTDFVQEFFGEGEIFGEVEMFEQSENFCSVEALNDFVVYKISSKNFFQLIQDNPEFNALILKALVRKIKYKAVRHAFHQLNSIETNLLNLLEQFPELFSKISKQDIASYLGITERSLNRSIKNLKVRRLI